MSRPERTANAVLALLLLAYIFNFLDRQILGILAQPIKADLHLSDFQFGALGGTAFVVLYALLGIPLAYLADRTSRTAVVALSLAVWSGFTALCGVASSFLQMFLYRVGVGIGEAGGVAPSYALVADYFPPGRRARALAIFSLGIPIGLGAGSLIGAFLAGSFGWRAAFVIIGIAGVVLAPILYLVVGDRRVARAAVEQQALSRVFAIVAKKPAFWLLALAASCSSLIGYGLALWTPAILMRSYGLDLRTTGLFVSSLVLIGGCSGILVGGWLSDRLGRADRGWYAKLPAIAWLITAPTFVAGFLAPTPVSAWLLLLVPNTLNLLWTGPVVTAVQHLVPPPMRATASACFLLINSLIGLGIGPPLIGRISDAFQLSYGADSLRYAAVACTVFYLFAAVLVLMCVKHLRQAWVDDTSNTSI